MTTKKKTEAKPNYKAQLEELKALTEYNSKQSLERFTALTNSNNQAVNDLRELIRLRGELGRAQASLDQAFVAIERKLRDTHTLNGFEMTAWLPK